MYKNIKQGSRCNLRLKHVIYDALTGTVHHLVHFIKSGGPAIVWVRYFIIRSCIYRIKQVINLHPVGIIPGQAHNISVVHRVHDQDLVVFIKIINSKQAGYLVLDINAVLEGSRDGTRVGMLSFVIRFKPGRVYSSFDAPFFKLIS